MNILQSLVKNRDAIAISFLFCGGPLNYIVRDGIGVAPNSTYFTMVFLFGASAFFFPFRDFKTMYSQNPAVTILALILLLQTYIFKRYVPGDGIVYAKSTYFDMSFLIECYFFIYLAFVKINSVKLNFLQIAMIISLLGSIGIMVYTLNNPDYVLGSRIGVNFSQDEGGFFTNPHIYGKGAFFGICCTLMIIKYTPSKLMKMFSYGCLLIFFAVLFMSQTMSSIFSVMLVFFVFTLANFRFVAGLFKGFLTKWYTILFVVLGVVKMIDVYQKNPMWVNAFYILIEDRYSKVMNTFFPEEDSIYSKRGKEMTREDLEHYKRWVVALNQNEDVEVDASALGRVETLFKVRKAFKENYQTGNIPKLLFGNGFSHIYVDIPIIEAFDSFGLFGFFISTLLVIYMFSSAMRELFKPTNIMSEWVSLAFIYFFVTSFTNGQLIDYNRWIYIALFCRFVPFYSFGINELKKIREKYKEFKASHEYAS